MSLLKAGKNFLQVFDNNTFFILSTVNCWPSENNEGGCDVNIEYELQLDDMELQDVVISIPVP